jgi:hypothetical protein
VVTKFSQKAAIVLCGSAIINFCEEKNLQVFFSVADPDPNLDPDRDWHLGHADPNPETNTDLYPFQQSPHQFQPSVKVKIN